MITAYVPQPTKTIKNMTNYETGAVRDTGGKGRMDLLPMCALIRVSKHIEDALKHYPERNWEKGLPIHTMIDSAFRHLAKYVDGMDDEDHLCAAATNLLMALWMEEKKPDMQDIPSRSQGRAFREAPNTQVALEAHPRGKRKEDPTETQEEVCPFFDTVMEDGVEPRYMCNSTRDHDFCTCGGVQTKCDFYPEWRRSAK